jgi:lincosamide nucleotidyltransferase A/C/D/E
MIHAHDVLEIVVGLQSAQIAIWLDGGRGVDALLGEQTRALDDLDVIFSLSDGDAAILALSRLGVAVAADERPKRFVVRDRGDRRIDCHTVTFGGEGGGVQQMPNGDSWRYPAHGFFGCGVVAGKAVRCLSPEVQLLCHHGYQPDDTDRRDMLLLAERFGLTLTEPFGS